MSAFQVKYTTSSNISLSGNVTVDGGATTSPGDRVLVKYQSPPSSNGVYVAASGAWSLASDNPTAVGDIVAVSDGTGFNGAGSVWRYEGTGTNSWTKIADPVNLLTNGGSTGLTLNTIGNPAPLATKFGSQSGVQAVSISLGGTLNASSGGTGLTTAGASGNVLMSNGFGWSSSPLPPATSATGNPYFYITGQAVIANISSSSANNIFNVNFVPSGDTVSYKYLGLERASGSLALGGKNGGGLKLRENVSGAHQGEVTLVGGTATVTTTAVGNTVGFARVFLTRNGANANAGHLYVDFDYTNSNFTITSTNSSDTGKVFWFLTRKTTTDPQVL